MHGAITATTGAYDGILNPIVLHGIRLITYVANVSASPQ